MENIVGQNGCKSVSIYLMAILYFTLFLSERPKSISEFGYFSILWEFFLIRCEVLGDYKAL